MVGMGMWDLASVVGSYGACALESRYFRAWFIESRLGRLEPSWLCFVHLGTSATH